MPKGEHLKGKGGKKFTSEYQPPNESKRVPKRIMKIRDAFDYFGTQLKSKVNVNNEEIELTFESNIGYKLMDMANKGDLKAIELLTKMMPDWLAPKEIKLTGFDDIKIT